MRRSARAWPTLSVVAAIAVGIDATGAARGDEARPAAARAAPVTEASVDSKLALVGKMVAPGGAGDVVDRSQDALARGGLERARAALVRAREARGAGRLPEADTLATEALTEFSAALRRVQSPRQAALQAKRQYDELRDRVTGFREAYLRVVAEKPRSRGGVLDESELDATIRQAQGYAREDRLVEAVGLLAKAAEKLELALTRLRDRETLVQELKFASAEDEFKYEHNRNRSYEMLVEIAMDEQRMSPRAREAASAALASNRDAREQAETLASGGDAKAGLKVLEDSTGRLIGALRAAGYPIP